MTSEQVNNAANELDVEKIRQDFPILQRLVNDKPLVYLDNAATTQKPQSVIDAIHHYYSHYNANVHRSIHQLGEEATQAYEDVRTKVQHFIHAKDFRECVFVRGTTEAINLVAHSFVEPRIRAGEDILVTEMEHHSNIVPWQLLCKRTAANLKVVPFNDDGELDIEAFKNLLTEDTKFLAITHISNALGTINPLKEIIQIAHDHDVVVLVDGAQAAPHMVIDVQDLDCDFYTFSGHKMYGPTGIGVLYAKAELLESMVPYQGGGEMISHVTFELTEYAPIPHKFEAGTPNIAGVIGLGAAIDYLLGLDLHAIAHYEHRLLEYCKEQSKKIDGIGYIGSAKDKAAIFTFVLKDIHAHDIGTILSSLGIAVRSGHHCAMPVMDHFQISAATRASFSFYNTFEEIDTLIDAIKHVETVMK